MLLNGAYGVVVAQFPVEELARVRISIGTQVNCLLFSTIYDKIILSYEKTIQAR